jgi:hypothetical protein
VWLIAEVYYLIVCVPDGHCVLLVVAMVTGDLRYRPLSAIHVFAVSCGAMPFDSSFLHVPVDDIVTLRFRELLRPSFRDCLLGCFSLLLAVEIVMDMLS